MRRQVNLSDISDGRLYGENDMVKADCHGCKDCHQCCTGMGDSVILDPYDVYRLQAGLGRGLGVLLEKGAVQLHVVDGCILPSLAMEGEGERCFFLDLQGRCSIHGSRPGICRLFPLGRYYEDGDFRYFLQTGECREKNRSKVKAGKWIDTPMLAKYHEFLCTWHYFLRDLEERMAAGRDQVAKELNLLLLQTFYLTVYDLGRDFYEQFQERLELVLSQHM